MRSPPDPYLRKGRPEVNETASKTESIAELLNRGHQLLLELDRRHKLIHDSVEDALRPEPQAWKGVKLAKGDYDKAYSELVALSKRINRLISEEHPELLRQVPPPTAVFGIEESVSRGRKRQPRR